MPTSTIKMCSKCGIDLNGQKRVKDPQGRYFCHLCWAAVAKRPIALEVSHTAKPVPVPASAPATTPVPPTDNTVQSLTPSIGFQKSAGEDRSPSALRTIRSYTLKYLWHNRWGKWGTLGVIIIVAVLAVPAMKAYQTTQDDKAAMDANAKAGADMFSKMAQSSERNAEEARKQAAALRAQASESDTHDDSGAVPDGPKSKYEAIHADAVIMGYLDSRPELESLIKTGGTQLDAHLQLLVTQDVLTASDVQYIRHFAAKIGTLH